MKSVILAAVFCFTLTACGNDWITPAAPPSGVVTPPPHHNPPGHPDAGIDAGDPTPPLPPVDAGDPGVDAGNTPVDAGSPLVDAGSPPPPPPVDAGSPPDVCDGSAIPMTGPYPDDCARLNWPITAPVTVTVGSGSVTITDFYYKTDQAGAACGFDFTSTVPVGYMVKAGLNGFTALTDPWMNPNGTSGPSVAGISNITLCPCGSN